MGYFLTSRVTISFSRRIYSVEFRSMDMDLFLFRCRPNRNLPQVTAVGTTDSRVHVAYVFLRTAILTNLVKLNFSIRKMDRLCKCACFTLASRRYLREVHILSPQWGSRFSPSESFVSSSADRISITCDIGMG